MFVVLACKVMVRVMVEVRVTSTVQVRARVRDQKPISRDCSLASELVQARFLRQLKFLSYLLLSYKLHNIIIILRYLV